MPATDALLKRFDFALTKKLGVIKLPPHFWVQDPKINPRAEQLFWVALVLKDRGRIDLALSVLSIELEQKISRKENEYKATIDDKAKELILELLDQFTDKDVRKKFEQDLCDLVPEWLTCEMEEDNE